MTTNVKIDACVSDDKEVHISISNGDGCEPEVIVVQNGESHSVAAYDEREICVKEVVKEIDEGTTEEV